MCNFEVGDCFVVLPGIKSVTPSQEAAGAEQKPTPTGTEVKHAHFSSIETVDREPHHDIPDNRAPTPSQARVQSARSRDISTAKLRKEAAQETKEVDKIADYFVPEWYKDPLIKPEPIKAGVSVFTDAGYC